ncbi:MAG: AbrB/MazE/SpoVT family DNA-binding domain-containing protein [bacterium]
MTSKKCYNIMFHGSTTLGEKGQVVIPSEAREKMKLKKGEKLLVFGLDNGMLSMFKLANLQEIETSLLTKLKAVQKVMKKVKNKKK